MRVLAFDATGPIVTVGVAHDGRALGRWDAPAQRARGNVLEMQIDRALAVIGWSRTGVDGLALVLGPGSLTATRIGWATAAGWALAASIPVTGWPTPVVQRRRWTESGHRSDSSSAGSVECLFCLVHHRGDDFYCYDLFGRTATDPPSIVQLGQWVPSARGAIRVVGPGVIGYRDRWRTTLGPDVSLADDADAIVGGDILALWGEEDLRDGRTLTLEGSPLNYGLTPTFRRQVER